MDWLTLTAALALLILAFISLSLFNSIRKVWHIPGTWQIMTAPFRIPFLTPYMHLSNHHSKRELAQRYGDPETGTVRISLLDRSLVFISDRDMLKEMIVTKGSNFPKNPKVYEVFNLFGENILTILDANSEKWRRHHKICSPAFASQNLEFVCQVAGQSTDLLFHTRWDHSIKQHTLPNGKTITGYHMTDPKVDFSDITLDVLGKAGFGLNLDIFRSGVGGGNDDKKGPVFRRALEHLFTTGILAKLFIGMSPIVWWLYPMARSFLGLDRSFMLVRQQLDEIIQERTKQIQQQIDEQGEIKTERRDLLSLMVEANFIQKGVLSDDEVKSDAWIFALAGHETSSACLQWTCYELARNVEFQRKAREEVDRLFGTGAGRRMPTYADCADANYVNCVIMESLRLHPPVISAFRVASKTTTLGKFTIPKGTICEFDVSNVGWKDSRWENPLEFNPERMPMDRNEREKIQNDFTWTPFSMGQRKCIGYKFALFEIYMVLSRILQCYEIELLNDLNDPKDAIHYVPGPTVGPGNLKLVFVKRQD